jgi:hydrogenase maturation protein HypF
MNYTKVKLHRGIKTGVLAVGAQSKSSFCFAKDHIAYLSDLGGDLDDFGNFKKFEKQIKSLQKKLKIKPDVIACDMHPEYLSTRYAYDFAKSRKVKMEGIQHHEAHIASCIADNHIKGKLIGIALDGTGFGTDGNIWGGEFFAGDIKGLKRAAYLKYIPMPGGEASIKEPWRMAFSYLYATYGKSRIAQMLNRSDKKKIDILSQMIDKNINSPLTSSMGRLFDAVSAIIGICRIIKYEGEAAIKLENIIYGRRYSSNLTGIRRMQGENIYKFNYIDKDRIVIVDWRPVIKGIIKDLKDKVAKPEISLKFHNAICDMIRDVCKFLKKRYKISKVCLTGGVFQNKYLKIHAASLLEKEGFEVYVHNKIPTHDAGIALGQAVLAGV